jgi:hypothetical protein
MKKETIETNRSLSDPELREKITYNILKKFAKKKNWKEYRYDDGFWMFGPDDEETRVGVEEKHQKWLHDKRHKHMMNGI